MTVISQAGCSTIVCPSTWSKPRRRKETNISPRNWRKSLPLILHVKRKFEMTSHIRGGFRIQLTLQVVNVVIFTCLRAHKYGRNSNRGILGLLYKQRECLWHFGSENSRLFLVYYSISHATTFRAFEHSLTYYEVCTYAFQQINNDILRGVNPTIDGDLSSLFGSLAWPGRQTAQRAPPPPRWQPLPWHG